MAAAKAAVSNSVEQRFKLDLTTLFVTLVFCCFLCLLAVMYDLGKLYVGTYFETDSMGETVVSTAELVKLLKDVQGAIEKGFEKEKDIAQEKDQAVRRLAEVVASAQAELNSISLLSMTKDKFSAVLKQLYDKLATM